MSSTEICLRPAALTASMLPAADVYQWLLAAAVDREQAVLSWLDEGVALLECGTVFSAIRVSGPLVRAAAGSDSETAVIAYLYQVLAGGPVFRDTDSDQYYALVPGGTAWVPYADRHGLEVLDQNWCLGVPAISRMEGRRRAWCVPVTRAGTLCDPDMVWALARCGQSRLAAGPAEAERGSPADPGAIRATVHRALWEPPPADSSELAGLVATVEGYARQLRPRLAALAPLMHGEWQAAAAVVLRHIDEALSEPATTWDLASRLHDLSIVVRPALSLVEDPRAVNASA
ncbi:hypothetical protein GTY54_07515 [Streptomyces sp. SID625]|nr:hypothetical protein [Streptomyces sp. SID625]